ncbi:hypothetical protein CcCBS67573_g06068 [Chytriomyces confervae]|uniref:Uncharacterized protein n=1 Tax=Chytriomyces confervae TaxID=246404 RepID=A0A507F7R8_9FUNG|nr:hypothetical protein CcCBS67573_g06068 [Chytriomyces confervae]
MCAASTKRRYWLGCAESFLFVIVLPRQYFQQLLKASKCRTLDCLWIPLYLLTEPITTGSVLCAGAVASVAVGLVLGQLPTAFMTSKPPSKLRTAAIQCNIHIIKAATIKAADVRRAYMTQIIDPKLKFPLVHRVGPSSKRHAKTFVAARPTTL